MDVPNVRCELLQRPRRWHCVAAARCGAAHHAETLPDDPYIVIAHIVRDVVPGSAELQCCLTLLFHKCCLFLSLLSKPGKQDFRGAVGAAAQHRQCQVLKPLPSTPRQCNRGKVEHIIYRRIDSMCGAARLAALANDNSADAGAAAVQVHKP